MIETFLGKTAWAAGASGSSVSRTERVPAGTTMDRPTMRMLACESLVANRPSAATPRRMGTLNRPGKGGLLIGARFFGGLTHR